MYTGYYYLNESRVCTKINIHLCLKFSILSSEYYLVEYYVPARSRGIIIIIPASGLITIINSASDLVDNNTDSKCSSLNIEV